MWTLGWPFLLLALPLPWLVRRYLAPATHGADTALRVPVGSDLGRLAAAGRTVGRSGMRLAVMWLVWGLIVVAAARPQYVGDAVSLPMTGRDLLLVVDLSGSMSEQDFQINGRWVNRLHALKAAADEFIAHRVGDRVGLILFGTRAYLQAPLTFDRKTVRTLLNEAEIGLAGRETAIGDAIGLGIKTFQDAGVQKGRRVMVLLTDGANTAGEVEPLKAAQIAADRGVIIYTIGIGADAVTVRTLFGLQQVNPSAELNEEGLKAIADMTGGRYFRVRDTQGFKDLYKALDRLEPVKSDEAGFRPVTDLFYWPLALAVLIAAVAGLFELLGPRVREYRLRRGALHG